MVAIFAQVKFADGHHKAAIGLYSNMWQPHIKVAAALHSNLDFLKGL